MAVGRPEHGVDADAARGRVLPRGQRGVAVVRHVRSVQVLAREQAGQDVHPPRLAGLHHRHRVAPHQHRRLLRLLALHRLCRRRRHRVRALGRWVAICEAGVRLLRRRRRRRRLLLLLLLLLLLRLLLPPPPPLLLLLRLQQQNRAMLCSPSIQLRCARFGGFSRWCWPLVAAAWASRALWSRRYHGEVHCSSHGHGDDGATTTLLATIGRKQVWPFSRRW